MKKLFGLIAFVLAGTGFASASVCPVTTHTNTDCGFILTIGPGGVVTGSPVAGANPYDGSDDSLVGVINNSGSDFTGSIALSGSGNGGGIFAFDGDGICTFIGPGGSDPNAAGSYCSLRQRQGYDPGDYEGPLNTFSAVNALGTSGDVNFTGLAAGGTTFFSLEGSPASITLGVPRTPAATPEPGSLILLSTGLAGVAIKLRRKVRL